VKVKRDVSAFASGKEFFKYIYVKVKPPALLGYKNNGFAKTIINTGFGGYFSKRA